MFIVVYVRKIVRGLILDAEQQLCKRMKVIIVYSYTSPNSVVFFFSFSISTTRGFGVGVRRDSRSCSVRSRKKKGKKNEK